MPTDWIQPNEAIWAICAGIVSWAAAYWILWRLDPETIGHLLKILLAVLPALAAAILGAGVVEEVVGVDRDWGRVAFLLGLAAALLVFWYFVPRRQYQQVMEAKGKYLPEFWGRVGFVCRLLIAAIVNVGVALALVVGGSQLLYGSTNLGLLVVVISLVVFLVLARGPLANWHRELREFVDGTGAAGGSAPGAGAGGSGRFDGGGKFSG